MKYSTKCNAAFAPENTVSAVLIWEIVRNFALIRVEQPLNKSTECINFVWVYLSVISFAIPRGISRLSMLLKSTYIKIILLRSQIMHHVKEKRINAADS